MGTVRIPLHSSKHPGLFALVDEEDAALVQRHRWHAWRRRDTARIYARTNVTRNGRRTVIFMHRLIMGLDHPAQVDHINRDGLDNRRQNLRFATAAQNNANRLGRPTATSRFKGVSWHIEGHKWRAVIKAHGKFYHLGMFDNELDAARAYDAAALDLFGEFAHLNFPTPHNTLMDVVSNAV